MPTIIEQLEQFVKDDPDDPFSKYALALEYQKVDVQKALTLFNLLLVEHETYVPTYYHLGKLYQQEGDPEMAVRTFDKGIEMARRSNDHKTLKELQSARESLLFDN
jgi:tetratricopeptide (TPR) repeat protein